MNHGIDRWKGLLTVAAVAGAMGGCKREDPMPSFPDLPQAFETGDKDLDKLAARTEPVPAPPGAGPTAAIQGGGEVREHDQAMPAGNRPPAPGGLAPIDRARASLRPTKGFSTEGVVKLERKGKRVHITGTISGLEPGKHGFHIHEVGDCSGPGAKAAGGHFAPSGHMHGDPGGPGAHHAGDFGNITANDEGVAELDLWSDLPLLSPGEPFVVGRAFVVHEGQDDLKSQPSGDSGARVACGVIENVGS